MATYYVRTDGNNANAGTSDSAGGAWATIAYAASQVAAGDTVMIRASAGNASSYPTSSLDYTISSFFTPAAGSVSAGFTRWIGYNGVPTIGCAGLAWYAAAYNSLQGLYLVGTGTGNAAIGMVNGDNIQVLDCVLNLNLQAALRGISTNNGFIYRTEIYGGSTSPTASSGADGIKVDGFLTLVNGCRIRYCRDCGINVPSDSAVGVSNTLIYGNVGNGIVLGGVPPIPGYVTNCTVNGNGGDGIRLSGTNNVPWFSVLNNNVTNHTGSGKYGIIATSSSSDKRKRGWGYNNVWNNTGAYSGVTADSTDYAADPGYANAATGDFTPSTTALRTAFPVTIP